MRQGSGLEGAVHWLRQWDARTMLQPRWLEECRGAHTPPWSQARCSRVTAVGEHMGGEHEDELHS